MNHRLSSTFLLVLCLALALASCAGKGVRGQPPFVQLNGLRLSDGLLNLDMGVRNLNSEAIFFRHIEFSVSIDDTSLAIYQAASQASISANGTENFRFELSPSAAGVSLLNELERGDRPNLAYSLEGVLLVEEDTEMKVQRKGRIFPVPGRPGHFR